MRKNINRKLIKFFVGATMLLGVSMMTYGSVNAKVTVPDTNANTATIGATMPYTRYDSTAASIGGGATLVKSTNFAKSNLASQASDQSYVSLPTSGSYVSWNVNQAADGITVRFTLPDSADGYGNKGNLDVYVNNKKVQTINLSSYYCWQYFSGGNPTDVNNGGTASFAFDEMHFKLSTALKAGDNIKLVSDGTHVYGVDFIEIEKVPSAIAKPQNAYSVTDYGADGSDEYDDYGAISKCIAAAKADGKDVYFPAGTYRISQMWRLNASNMKITGAGMWYTNIQFTNASAGKGGISGDTASNIEFCNMYINSNLRSRYNEKATYKCFMDNWTDGCYIHDVWEEHFECGVWLADYATPIVYSDNMLIYNCRLRNNLADGVNFCQGTSNSTVYNCSIRNNGDDGLAMWNNNYLSVKDETNNRFCYNTIDLGWRAGAIAIYGGNGHRIYNNYIKDMFMASGIHLNTNFGGYKFDNNKAIDFENNILVPSGTISDSRNSNMGAIDIYGDVKNINFTNTHIYNSQHDAIRIYSNPSDYNIVFNNTSIYGTGKDGQTVDTGDNGAAIRYETPNKTKFVKFNGLTYADIPYTNIIYGSRLLSDITNENNLGNNYTFVVPAGTTKCVVTPIKVTPNVTTASNATTANNKVKVKATKIKSAKRKSKKKIKVTVRKVGSATGYQIQICKTKKFKKLIINKKIKKTSVTLSSSKLKSVKKVYIRARAYKLVGKNSYYSAWTKAKRY